MCTVTYLPAPNGFLLTSNRDEAFARKPAAKPAIYPSAKGPIIYPRDGDAGGTWIATSDNNRAACLLNGAFYPHKHEPPYRKSRGLVVLDYFDSDSIDNFVEAYNLNGIEAFTMLIIEGKKLYELRWDGSLKFFKELDATQPHIRCSVTLYTTEVISLRQKWFSDWLKTHTGYSVQEILKFHLFAGENDPLTNIRMTRGSLVKTVSITCIERGNEGLKMYCSDLKGDNGFHFSEHAFSASESGQSMTFIEQA